MKKVCDFTLLNDYGEEVKAKDLAAWASRQSPWRTFDATGYCWYVEGERFFCRKAAYWVELPDSSGFICFYDNLSNDNCSLLDVYGRERFRLAVPCELTPYEVPPGAEMWFRNIGTHPNGQFGVTAWIEYVGDFYFELDYRGGRFLWGKEIRF